MANVSIDLKPACAADLDALVDLRIEAMRESLERVGRFDRARAGQRLRDGFDAACTRHIEKAGARMGFVVVKPQEDGLLLDHLYLRPEFQGLGIGAKVLNQLFSEADAEGLKIQVGALRDNDANRFYLRHGFVLTHRCDWDNYYVRLPQTR